MVRVYTSDDFTDAYDNATYGTYMAVADIGGYIYKSYESIFGAPALFVNHIKPLVEPNAGAHYYVQSPYKSTNRSVSARVKLSDVDITHCTRNGYISLGIVGTGSTYGSFDIGMVYDKNRSCWKPCAMAHVSDPNNEQSMDQIMASLLTSFTCTATGVSGLYNFYESNYNPTYARMDISIARSGNKDTVTYKFVYEDANKNEIKSCTAVYTFNKGEFFESSQLACRFFRFISLVPTEKYLDVRDYSVLKAHLMDMKINSSAWTVSDIDYAWSVQGANIRNLKISTLSGTTSNYDEIDIYHQYELHETV